jgi:glucose-1-phosphate cytidylyltransferase
MATYGDGVADIDLVRLLRFHRSHGKLATVTGVHPSSRFGELSIDNGMVRMFREKPQIDEGWINGGFFIFEPDTIGLIEDDSDSLEADLLMRLTERNELAVYQHHGFWQCMDTYRETKLLNELWAAGQAPWFCTPAQ